MARYARRITTVRLWLLLLGGLLLAAPLHAHRLSPAYFGLIETAPGQFSAEWKVSIPGGLADVLEPQVPAPCTIAGTLRRSTVDDASLMQAQLVCEGALAGSTFTVRGLEATDTDVLFRISYLDGSGLTHRLVPSAPSVVIPAEPGAGEVAMVYLVLGVEHILGGIDHLLFVFALLLLVTGWRRLIATITAFTLAHSLTLAAATLGIVNVPGGAVEAVIALSILFLADELIRRPPAQPAGPGATLAVRFPWLVAFVFGLLHGFGFAGALAEVGLPQSAIPLALLFFNLGVEAGQLLFIAVCASVWLGWRHIRLPQPVWARRLAAYGIGSVAAFWVFERTISSM